MYSILKIGCFIKGCCYSAYLPIPIQLIESLLSFLSFIFLIYLKRKGYTSSFLISLSMFLFALIRLVAAFFRDFSTYLGFILNQIICIILIILSIYFFKNNKKNH